MAPALPVITSAALNKERRKAVERLVRPLVAKPPAQILQIGPGVSAYSLGAVPLHSGVVTPDTNPEYVVGMVIDGFLFNYYETWLPRSDGDFQLERAYLHIHRSIPGRERRVQVLSPALRPVHDPGRNSLLIQARAAPAYPRRRAASGSGAHLTLHPRRGFRRTGRAIADSGHGRRDKDDRAAVRAMLGESETAGLTSLGRRQRTLILGDTIRSGMTARR